MMGLAPIDSELRQILYGLCTYGVAGHAILKARCDYDPWRLTMRARFSAPVFPGRPFAPRCGAMPAA